MRKKTVSMKMDTDLLAYIDQIADQNQTSRSKTLELFIDIIRDYLTSDQLYQEYYVRGEIDGRRKFGE